MTTPQNVLYEISHKINGLNKLLRGYDEEDRRDIMDFISDIEVEVTGLYERFELLEDKMNIIIKLLGKEI